MDSEAILKKLILDYQNLVFSICLKLTGDYFVAEDLAQETFISAYTKLDSFDGNNEKAWLCRIASNKCIDYQRMAARREQATPDEDIENSMIPTDNEPLKETLNSEVMETLEKCCRSLPPPYDEIAYEHFINGKTAKELAQERNELLKTMQTQLYRARDKIKEKYRKENLI